MESNLVKNIYSSICEAIERIQDSNGLFGFLYMFLILPLFLLFLVGAAVSAIPGYLVHYLFWHRCDIKNKSEFIKVAHDVTLIFIVSISVVAVILFGVPYLGSPSGEVCSTYPYC